MNRSVKGNGGTNYPPRLVRGSFSSPVFLLLYVCDISLLVRDEQVNFVMLETCFPSTYMTALLIDTAESSDPYKCQALIDGGHWYNGYEWLIDGCGSLKYGPDQIRRCAGNRKIVFAGDTYLQRTFWAVLKKLDHSVSDVELQESDIVIEKDRVGLEFLWDPYLNGTQLMEYVGVHGDGGKGRPTILVVGPSQWQLETGAVGQFAGAIEGIARTAYGKNLWRSVTSRPYSYGDGLGDVVLFAPAQMPYTENGNNALAEYQAYDEMNDELRKRSDQQGIDVLWSFDRMTRGHEEKFVGNANLKEDAFKRRADVLLNLRCNAHMAGGYPHTATCCGTWERLNWIQTTFLTLGLGILPAIFLLDWWLPMLKDENRSIVRAFCAFVGAVSLQYLADRTHVFEQVTRLPLQLPNLRKMIAVAFIIGFATIRKSKPPGKPNLSSGRQLDQPFLSRDQSDEWKGWMQALIITYHYNMAWSADWFWEIIRLAVASYLFLTGFGHTVFFLQKKDFSFKRFAAVMMRTNLLPVALAYVMRTRWLLYYYMPLSTFWYFMVYVTMAIGKKWNDHTPLLLAKIAFSAATVTAFLNIKDLPETVVRFFNTTCKMSFSADSFFHNRVSSDRYIVYVGMVVGIFYVWSKDVLSSDKRQDSLSCAFRRVFPWIKWFTVILSAVGMMVFWYFAATRFHSQPEWSAWQPYIGFIPILAFTVLRNAHPVLRNYFSVAFAWLGKYSGEMYVMQDHIWLAGDQESVLRTGFFHGDDTLMGDRWRDLVLVTPLYLIACSIIGDATATITTWFVTESEPSSQSTSSMEGHDSAPSPVAEVELGLLSTREEDEEMIEVADLNEKKKKKKKTVPRNTNTWNTMMKAVPRLWPRRVGNRAVLVLVGLWILNWTSVR